ncbi:hypothetical protein [Miltoncostaea oceani]|uniref:hypothetical protein n=1 Tax=Miltoncostaea oceani TaxID=2843216 RepID=UPI001C3E39DA|nr:hypothetical protein [Miltoncostaea oceani]
MPDALERRLRDARPSPPASAEARRLAARRVVLEERATGRSRRWGGWGLLRPALGVLGLVAAVGLVAVLLVAGPKGAEEPAGLRFAGRPDPGTALRLTVEPVHPGLTAAQAAERSVAVVRARAAALGVSGLEAVPGAGGTVQVWVPESAAEGALDTLLDPARLSVVNLTTVSVAGGFATPRAMLRSSSTNGEGLPGATFHVVDPLTGALLGGPAPTRREAEADAGPGRPREVLALPPGVLLVRGSLDQVGGAVVARPEGGWMAIGDGPAVRRADIARLEPAVGGVRAVLTRPLPRRVGRAGHRRPGPELVLLVEGGARRTPELTGTLYPDRPLTGARSVVFAVPEEIRARTVALFAAGELPARLRVDAQVTTGR